MQREHRPAAWQHRAEQAERQEARRETSADVQVDDVGVYRQEQLHDLPRRARVVHVVVGGPPVPREVEYRGARVMTVQMIPDRHEIGLHAPVRWRVRAQLQDDHQAPLAGDSSPPGSRFTGARVRADSSMARHPSVDRVPSWTVTGAGVPVRTAATNDSTSPA